MLQGARHEHAQAVEAAAASECLGVEVVELRTSEDVQNLDALILPGGESTTMRLASDSRGLLDSLFGWMQEFPAKPVLATCAGAILLCDPGDGRDPLVDAGISRNSFGRQVDSFQAVLDVELDEVICSEDRSYIDSQGHSSLLVSGIDDSQGFPGVFIRAPRFTSVDCTPVAMFGTEVVGVLDGHRMALTFHPELTSDRRFHHWLLNQASA